MGIVNEYVNKVRHEFATQELNRDSVNEDPRLQMEKWIEEAVDSQILEPNAMLLSTVSAEGKPSSRVVYLRGLDENGLKFYTNYLSRKGEDIEQNPNGTSLFFYPELERQIRIEGRIEKLSSADSDAYFEARPLESKLGAWASSQSSTIENRESLMNRLEDFREKFGNDVPRPPHWGGYRLIPDRFEFWQGRPSRLHDRIVYTRESNQWIISRIAP